ncbi:Gmad2 immunoglobulin-like domain-containing protein [Candidatus Uhrbacteria bacterium]|nr:Gmad2 immunoglobulin-like domain-containing protein [Candidatus Uhrbacteria bacterium]
MKKSSIFIGIVVVAFIAYWVFRRPLEAPTVSQNAPAVETGPLAESVQSQKDKVERVAESVSSKDAAGLTNENIRVTSPKPDATLTSPFAVVGEARVFENVVNIRVTNAKGEAFINETAYAKAPDAGQFGPFTINLSYKFKNTKEGFVEVYHASPKDGSDQDLVRIPVKFE